MPNLYVTESGSRLEKEAGRLLVTKDDDVLLAVPATRIENVVIVGNVGVTTPALGFLLDRKIGLVFLTARGEFRGRLSADLSKNVELRRRQFQRADDSDFCLSLARSIVAGKIRNCRTLCMRLDSTNRDPLVCRVIDDLRELLTQLDLAGSRESLMGLEGQAAHRYFDVFEQALRPPWTFTRRARRPPPDPVNALLSLVYTLLHESCYAALEAAGLDPYCGCFHQPRYGRASLALDLMEEFRPVIADSVVLTILNKRMLSPDDFAPGAGGQGVYLDHNGWRTVAAQYNQRLRTLVRPAGQERRISYQKLLEVQARRLRRAIESEEPYQPFLTK